MSLLQFKSAHGERKGLLNQLFLTRHARSKASYTYSGAELYKMFIYWALVRKYTQVFETLLDLLSNIKSSLLQNGPHHNSSSRGIDKNVFQIFLHNIGCKPWPSCILNGIDYTGISPLILYIMMSFYIVTSCGIKYTKIFFPTVLPIFISVLNIAETGRDVHTPTLYHKLHRDLTQQQTGCLRDAKSTGKQTIHSDSCMLGQLLKPYILTKLSRKTVH
jgi:hypothetical protein